MHNFIKMKKVLLLILLLSSVVMYSQEYKQMIDAGTFTVQEIQQKAAQAGIVTVNGSGNRLEPALRKSIEMAVEASRRLFDSG